MNPPMPMEGMCSSAQTGIWFAERLEDGQPRYHLASAIELDGDLDVPALERAFRSLFVRHPILLATYPERDGGPVREDLAPERWALDRRSAGGDLDGLLRALTVAPFDLGAARCSARP